jgi:hypothetical protein
MKLLLLFFCEHILFFFCYLSLIDVDFFLSFAALFHLLRRTFLDILLRLLVEQVFKLRGRKGWMDGANDDLFIDTFNSMSCIKNTSSAFMRSMELASL